MAGSDTIYAVATGAGRAAISIVRLSGPVARQIVQGISGRLPEPRQFRQATLRHPEDRLVIDRAVVIWLPGPNSVTGEDCAEFHIHASPAVLTALFRALSAFPGTRPAEAGEFTRRAVRNGKMDLVEAEGLADLLDARTAAQRELALGQMSGQSSSRFEIWRGRLLEIRASIEAVLDFSEEPGVAEDALPRIDGETSELVKELEQALAGYRTAEVIRDGVRVVLAGLPNTGKSSLLNAIARREAAIVSAIPGTTRDVIEVQLDLDGIPVVLTDTAGLRYDVADEVEREGIRRTGDRLRDAQLVLWVSAPDVPGSEHVTTGISPDIIVRCKADLLYPELGLNRNESSDVGHYLLSIRDGRGLGEFVSRLSILCRERFALNDSVLVTTERQSMAVADSIRFLNNALACRDVLELKAENIGSAASAIGRITGRTDVEEWLGSIFSRFCIGK